MGCSRRLAQTLLTRHQLAKTLFTVENENHCDFRKLRTLLIRTHMLDLISSTEELHYENYRQQQMETRKFGETKPKKLDNPKFKEEEESLRKRFTEQVKAEEARFRQWEQHVRGRAFEPNIPLLTISIHSLSPSVIGSTRISRPPTAPSRHSRLSLITSRLAMAGARRGDRSVLHLKQHRQDAAHVIPLLLSGHTLSLLWFYNTPYYSFYNLGSSRRPMLRGPSL